MPGRPPLQGNEYKQKISVVLKTSEAGTSKSLEQIIL